MILLYELRALKFYPSYLFPVGWNTTSAFKSSMTACSPSDTIYYLWWGVDLWLFFIPVSLLYSLVKGKIILLDLTANTHVLMQWTKSLLMVVHRLNWIVGARMAVIDTLWRIKDRVTLATALSDIHVMKCQWVDDLPPRGGDISRCNYLPETVQQFTLVGRHNWSWS